MISIAELSSHRSWTLDIYKDSLLTTTYSYLLASQLGLPVGRLIWKPLHHFPILLFLPVIKKIILSPLVPWLTSTMRYCICKSKFGKCENIKSMWTFKQLPNPTTKTQFLVPAPLRSNYNAYSKSRQGGISSYISSKSCIMIPRVLAWSKLLKDAPSEPLWIIKETFIEHQFHQFSFVM